MYSVAQWRITLRLHEVEPEAQFAAARPAAHIYILLPVRGPEKARGGRGAKRRCG